MGSKVSIKATLVFAVVMAAISCTEKITGSVDVIPCPQEVRFSGGSFCIKGADFSCDKHFDAKIAGDIDRFAESLSNATGEESIFYGYKKNADVFFKYDENVPAENYVMDIRRNRLIVKASDLNGVVYAIETIRQLLPVSVYSGRSDHDADWTLPCGEIVDGPRFTYRGLMLDVARHFFSVAEIKKILDIMAMHKLNRLHWHLTDDQGWRIEINKYPELTEIGAYRDGTMLGKQWGTDDGIRYGGFYTQDDIREIVSYASYRGISIIPEIDLPGHMLAALATYPDLGCTGGPYKVWNRWGVSEDVLCVGKEGTMEFIEDVLKEIMQLFPSEYIHIGGDECPKDRWKTCLSCQSKIKELGLQSDEKHPAEYYLQSYVTERVGNFLAKHGRKLIGWDEILEGKLADGATVMSWRGSDGGMEAASIGHDAIMTPNSHMYFDYYQAENTEDEPLAIGGYIPVEKVYSYEPILDEAMKKHVLGVQANVWTEYITTYSHLEYMLLPRLAALSEVQWCRPEIKDWDRFFTSLHHISDIYDELDYNYAETVFSAGKNEY